METHNNSRPSAEHRSTAIAYRPRAFSELVGQEFVAHAITHALEQQSVAHAYLLCGPRGVGKTTTARLLAQYLNHGGESTDQQWEAIRNGSGLDVIEIDGASNTSVQDVRQIKENILYPPQASRYKIYIIDEVHMLSTSAFNALLKTIEEPPPYVVFIFATTEAEKLPMTVRSRCQQFHFRLIPTDVIATQLTEVAAQLNIAINQEVVYWIAREAQGSMRDAYTLFDQLSVLGDDLLNLDTLRKHFGFAETKQLAELIVLLSQQQIAKAMQLFDTILNAGVSIESICNDMTQLYRVLLMHGYGIEVSHTEMIPPELASVLTAYTDTELLAIIEELVNVFQSLKDSLNPRFSCELALARIGYIKDRVTVQDIQHTLANMSTGMPSGLRGASMSGTTRTEAQSVTSANNLGSGGAVSERSVGGGTSNGGGTSHDNATPHGDATIAPSNDSAAGGFSTSNDAAGGTMAPTAQSATTPTDGANTLATTSGVGGGHSVATPQSTATLDPLMPHTSASLRSELTRGMVAESSNSSHHSSVSAGEPAIPSDSDHTTKSTATDGASQSIATEDTSQSTAKNRTSESLSTDGASYAVEETQPVASSHIVSPHGGQDAHSPPRELSIDEISQIVNKAVVNKPIIHNLLIHDCTWSRQQQTITIATPTEFDKTSLAPYHHALSEAVRNLLGQSYTITLQLAAKDSNTDKLISMTKKMFNAVE